ncbi:GNAT family N-acetyltransferase [uncultured Kingella sp.]|uniref:GNAT family N-acetyltransferase n=1 Tax=uncultured Kingella sp. TaxID=159270 RepID=UPI0025931FEF|nr:GNAT family N-acetyltransferase [uncultured Kingella sp.]
MQFIPIPLFKQPHLRQYTQQLYQQAFPAEDRFPFWSLLLFSLRPAIRFDAIVDEQQQPIGFVYLIRGEGLLFVLYFAVDAQCRSQGYGSRIIVALEQQYPSDTIVLDIRAPDAAAADALQRQKRLDFYLRNGFQIAPYQWVEAAERYAVLYKGDGFHPRAFETLLAKTTFNLIHPTLQAA